MYIVLVVGGYGLFVMDAYPRIPNAYMDSYHKCVNARAASRIFAVTSALYCCCCLLLFAVTIAATVAAVVVVVAAA